MFHVLVASLKLPVIGIYDPFPAENDFFFKQILQFGEFWTMIQNAGARWCQNIIFLGGSQRAFAALHTQLGKYNY